MLRAITILAVAVVMLLALGLWYGEQRYKDCLYAEIGSVQADNTGASAAQGNGTPGHRTDHRDRGPDPLLAVAVLSWRGAPVCCTRPGGGCPPRIRSRRADSPGQGKGRALRPDARAPAVAGSTGQKDSPETSLPGR